MKVALTVIAAVWFAAVVAQRVAAVRSQRPGDGWRE